MAAVAEEERDTRPCSNCKKDIPVANAAIHEIHCSRNIRMCPVCMEPFPKSEMRSHLQLVHEQVTCKCSRKMERGLLQGHMASECPLRPVTCQHCEIELAFSKLQEHEDYCGARTERCGRCGRNVMLRDLKRHPEDCAKQAEEVRDPQAKSCLNSKAIFRTVPTSRNNVHPDVAVGSLPRVSRIPESRLYNYLSGDQLPRELGRRGVVLPHEQDRAHLGKLTTPPPFGGEPDDYNLDYLLALSLQHEHSSCEPRGIEDPRDLWTSILPPRTRPAENVEVARGSSIFSQDLPMPPDVSERSPAEILLPCEFCEELFPEGELILHQTGCSPSSALASFSKSSAFIPQSERLWALWEQLQKGRSQSPEGGSERRPLQPESCGCLMLPCEFCGVQLEEEILFHHQDQCDLRPATATPSAGGAPLREGAQARPATERAESPDPPRRRLRHQGEVSPQYLEELSPQNSPGAPQLVQGSCPRATQVAVRRIQLTSPNNLRENHTGPSRAQNSKDLGGGCGRLPSRGQDDRAAGPQAPRASAPSFPPSIYEPSFPGTIPTRPSLMNEGGRSLARAAHGSSTKAKPWCAESNYPDNE
ncbi:TRAF-type zinc finger domain-containing protein 1 isoform X2 [Varanus komodoensis]|uniref:TRAF-type zinc finger domain-containing protein 1 n=1 Tax=Varanus komodoensis TaxID=61221 RepID=A0A8D2JH00_VARKO|nr:TRAF-type zinc finger domain-containing protein 1 isoform X2 [Varanus komodoensis]